MKFWTVLLAMVLAFGAMDADAARRLGGGGSMGRQSSNVTQRQSSPPAVAPTAPSNAQRPAATPGTPAAAQPARRPWGGILGGLAAGLGLAWLAHSLGLGAGFGNILLLLIVGMLVVVAIGMMRRRQAAPAAAAAGYGYRNAGGTVDAPASPRQYNPEKVGNDASARPWESTTGFGDAPSHAGSGVRIGSALGAGAAGGALQGSQAWGIPPGFDTEGFLQAAKRNFITLQDAWDRGDLSTLRSMMTDEMLQEIRKQMAERDRAGPAVQKTEVVMLEAQLLGIEELATEYLASVEFSGLMREEPSAGPTPFREVWNMVKPKDGGAGWLVAGVQALQ